MSGVDRAAILSKIVLPNTLHEFTPLADEAGEAASLALGGWHAADPMLGLPETKVVELSAIYFDQLPGGKRAAVQHLVPMMSGTTLREMAFPGAQLVPGRVTSVVNRHVGQQAALIEHVGPRGASASDLVGTVSAERQRLRSLADDIRSTGALDQPSDRIDNESLRQLMTAKHVRNAEPGSGYLVARTSRTIDRDPVGYIDDVQELHLWPFRAEGESAVRDAADAVRQYIDSSEVYATEQGSKLLKR